MKLSILLIAVLLSSVCNAQSFFKADPLGLQRQKTQSFGFRSNAVVTLTDSTFTAFRPIANIAAYGEPGNFLLAGIGAGFQHLRYTYATQTYNCLWSINAIAWAGGSVAPNSPSSIASFGLMLGLDNNLINFGPGYNPGTKQFFLAVSVGINFNNL